MIYLNPDAIVGREPNGADVADIRSVVPNQRFCIRPLREM